MPPPPIAIRFPATIRVVEHAHGTDAHTAKIVNVVPLVRGQVVAAFGEHAVEVYAFRVVGVFDAVMRDDACNDLTSSRCGVTTA